MMYLKYLNYIKQIIFLVNLKNSGLLTDETKESGRKKCRSAPRSEILTVKVDDYQVPW